MCSIGEDDFGDEGGVHAMVKDEKLERNLIEESDSQPCNKCKKSGAIYKVPFRQAECRECFLLFTRHKFRAALGSSKVLPKDAKVILIFDGSADSVVLLDMLSHAQTQSTFKRLHCTATVLYIDESHLLERDLFSDKEYNRFLEKLEIFLQKFTCFDSFIVPLVNDAIDCITNIKSMKEKQYNLLYKDKKQSLRNSIDSIKSLTSRQDFVKCHRKKLIAAVAEHFKIKFVFVSDTSHNLATDLLAAVVLGRGGSAALDVALIDDRLSNGVKLIRPLKDLNLVDIDLYLKAQNLEPLQNKRFGCDAGSTASLQNLTKSFVDNLQRNFSATVSTVFRTGDKIAVNQYGVTRLSNIDINDLEMHEKCCYFCNSFLDYHDSTTLLAIEFSRLASESGCTMDDSSTLYVKAKENVQGSTEKKYLKKLCHACRNICMDSSNQNLLL